VKNNYKQNFCLLFLKSFMMEFYNARFLLACNLLFILLLLKSADRASFVRFLNGEISYLQKSANARLVRFSLDLDVAKIS
jgi:hypothetical protein